MIDNVLYTTKKIIPKNIFSFLAPMYHYLMAFLGALIYHFPSRKIIVVAVTGTKGKSSVTEILNAILEEAGYKTAVSNTIRFKIGNESKDNMFKMSMPGRMFMQKFLRNAVDKKCRYAIIEMTSQGALLYRHKFIDLDGLIFTNLAPEHIEAHGSYEKYVNSKLKIAESLSKSKKPRTIMVVNHEDKESSKFLAFEVKEKYKYSISDAKPYIVKKQGVDFTIDGLKISSHLSGEFNIYNILAAITFAKTQDMGINVIERAIEKFKGIRGRVEYINEGQNFNVVVDYAHTPDSLQKFYDVFQNTRRICVLGNTGGGRDVWKRDEMAKIAERECDEIILTNEDPYDDDPLKIVEDMNKAMNYSGKIIMDRRKAIFEAISTAKTGDSVLITGKGTDPYIMGPFGTKTHWSDANVAREELKKVLGK